MPKTAPPVPVIKPGHVLRLVKAGKMPKNVKGGRYRCKKCGRLHPAAMTESPEFHENGGYVYCPNCKVETLYVAEFPSCPGYPQGFHIDVSGERKKYPLVLPKGA